MQMQISNTLIGDDYPTFIIAEMSANHNGDICRAFKIMGLTRVI